MVLPSSSHKAVFRFGHAETLLPLMALMGLHRDPVPLRADNFREQKDRLFRTSTICPFSANVMLVLYHSDSGSPAKHLVKLVVNEQPVKFPFCSELLCPLETVVAHYKNVIEECNFNKMCGNKSTDLLHQEL